MGRHRTSAETTREATSDPDIGELSGTVRRGAAISAVTLVVVQVLSFAQTLVLARLLSPEEIGLFAAGTVMSGFLIGFSEGGLRGALVQRKERVADAADTVFWVTAATGALLALGSLLISPLVGDLFQDDVAGVIAAVSSGTLLMHALTNVPDGLMQRRFNFKRRLIVEPSRVLAYAIVSITLAATGFGVWALVIANYAGLTVWLVGTWVLAKWRPGIGKPSYRLWREMARFAAPLLAEGMVGRIRTASETALVGRTLQADTLGQYRYGQRLSMLPALAIVQVGSYVLFPAFSRLADQPDRLKRAFVKALQLIWVVAIPIAGLTLALGEPGVVLLLGEEWRGAGLAVMAMSGYGVGVALQAAGSEVIKASGRSSLLNYTTVTSLVLGIGLLAALLPLGLLGVGLAISITEIAVGVVVLVLVRRIVPFPVGKMAWLLVPPTFAAAVAMVAIGALDRLVVRADAQGTLLGIVLLLVEVVAFGAVYLGVLGLIAPALRRTVVDAVRSRLAKRRAGAADQTDDEPFDMDAATTWFRLPDELDATMQMPAVAVRRRPPPVRPVPARVPPGVPAPPGAPLRGPVPGPGRGWVPGSGRPGGPLPPMPGGRPPNGAGPPPRPHQGPPPPRPHQGSPPGAPVPAPVHNQQASGPVARPPGPMPPPPPGRPGARPGPGRPSGGVPGGGPAHRRLDGVGSRNGVSGGGVPGVGPGNGVSGSGVSGGGAAARGLGGGMPGAPRSDGGRADVAPRPEPAGPQEAGGAAGPVGRPSPGPRARPSPVERRGPVDGPTVTRPAVDRRPSMEEPTVARPPVDRRPSVDGPTVARPAVGRRERPRPDRDDEESADPSPSSPGRR